MEANNLYLDHTEKKKRALIFGSLVDPLTMEETLQSVERIVDSRQTVQHVVINVAKLVLMQKDEHLRQIVNSCGLINCDGQGVIMGAKFLGMRIPERVTGIDLFLNLVERSEQKGYKLYFFGATEQVVQKTIRELRSQYPDLKIAGYHNGYYSREQEAEIVQDIKASGADILFVAMSSPQKEIFLNKYIHEMNVPFVMGVGGSFDIVAGVTFRAPLWMQKAGLEWFHRLLNEPARMWKRYLTSNSIFLWMLIKAKLFGKERYGCFQEDRRQNWQRTEPVEAYFTGQAAENL